MAANPERTHPEIWIEGLAAERKRLRSVAKPFDFSSMPYKELAALIRRMRKIMREANGVGLAANQIGLPHRLFVAEVPVNDGTKFYSVINPAIEKMSTEKATIEEGCLSVPGIWGDAPRAERVTLVGQDLRGKSLKIKAWGLLARVFQHETDHLDGKLFIDKAKNLHRAEKDNSEPVQDAKNNQ